MTDAPRPIIIRRKKVYAAEGHHGGAWKVAYADFVTAMMAFFLLMWLLNATTEEQRKGIADYFNPNIPIAAVSGGGAGALSGDSIFTQDTLAQSGIGARTESTEKGKDESAAKEGKMKEQLETLNAALQNEDESLTHHVQLKSSSEGLVIELIDSADESLFEIGSANPSPLLNTLLDVVAIALGNVNNPMKIIGHTDGRTFPNSAQYSNWELSIDRANASRRLLSRLGVDDGKIIEVSGKGSTDPLSDDPLAPANRRISIILINQSPDRVMNDI